MPEELGILQALQGQDPWDAIRQERQRELQLNVMRNGMAKQAFQEKQLAAKEFQDAMQVVGKIRALDPDIDRVNALNDQLTEKIRKGIYDAGGDAQKWLSEGGRTQLAKYKDELINSPQVAKAIMNATNYNHYLKNQEEGLIHRGMPQEDFGKFKSGETDFFPYAGAYKQPNLPDMRKNFGEVYGKSKYGRQEVDDNTMWQYVIAEAKKEGLAQRDAEHFADRTVADYQRMKKSGGQPIMFKSDNWTPPAGYGAEAQNEEAMKYILEGAQAALSKDIDPNFWTEKNTIPDPKTFFGFAGNPVATFYSSPRLAGLPLGKANVPNYEVKQNSKQQYELVANGTRQIDNVFRGFVRGENGSVYYHTDKSDIEGKNDPYKRFIPFTEASIDELVLAAPAAQRPKLAAALRRGLKELNSYKNGTPTLGQNGRAIAAPGYTIGEVQSGYKYMGGDPKDQNNWKKQ